MDISQKKNHILHVITTENSSLLNSVINAADIDSNQAHFLLSYGAIYKNRKRVLKDSEIFPGDYLRVHLLPKRFPISDIDWKSHIVFEDNDFILVNKPPEIPVHPTLDNAIENVLYQLSSNLSTALWVTGRLDVPTHGLLVFAKTQAFQSRFNRWLEERKVEKKYRALVKHPPLMGNLIHYMKPGNRAPKILSLYPKDSWMRCELEISHVKALSQRCSDLLYEVDIVLITGRTHQIRAQLAALGSPILGDPLYTNNPTDTPPPLKISGIALQAHYLKFPHPNGKMHIEFSLPSCWNLKDELDSAKHSC